MLISSRMATESQLNANRQNSQLSTGPVTESGKAKSSRNALTLGLYTRQDYVKPEERDFYKEFCEQLYNDLLPMSHLEETFVSEIIGASWRLRRCSIAESELEAWDDTTEKTRQSIDRARAAALNILNKSLNQLRKLQTERATMANPQFSDAVFETAVARIMSEPPAWAVTETCEAGVSACPPPVGSNCKTAQAPQDIARNAPCPCRSGQKYKRCCGRTAPPLLFKAA